MQDLTFPKKWFLYKEISSIVISILRSIVAISFLFLIKSLTRDEAIFFNLWKSKITYALTSACHEKQIRQIHVKKSKTNSR